MGRVETIAGNDHIQGEATGVAGEEERRRRSCVTLAGLGRRVSLGPRECGMSDQEKGR